MVMEDHLCPCGLKAKDLLERKGFEVDDHWLRTREETDEALAGILMIAGALLWIAVPVALFIGTVGAVSVFKAVCIDRRELECACVGGNSYLPLGFISLTENLMMVGMGVWMTVK
ncbi:MAG: hypothetical protein GEU92_18780 [Alphaproteobacteria bacterium]|nr:hypothetical protein [Alphaproteobacteria bacterium]